MFACVVHLGSGDPLKWDWLAAAGGASAAYALARGDDLSLERERGEVYPRVSAGGGDAAGDLDQGDSHVFYWESEMARGCL